jgi:hypothetical protein
LTGSGELKKKFVFLLFEKKKLLAAEADVEYELSSLKKIKLLL